MFALSFLARARTTFGASNDVYGVYECGGDGAIGDGGGGEGGEGNSPRSGGAVNIGTL